MTAITQSLPWFLRDPAIALIGEKCYTSLVVHLHVSDTDCLKYALSKGLGLGIVVGGSIVKVPQILLLVSAQSARGLSLSAYVLETFAYAITLVYSFRNNYPFSTYGENLFMTFQNAIITILIVYFPTGRLSSRPKTTAALFTSIASIICGLVLYMLPQHTLQLLQAATLPISVLSKLPQIQANRRAKSTGQLSAFAVGSQVAGCLARMFTTATEMDDSILFAGFALTLVLNAIVALQMYVYWGKDVATYDTKIDGVVPVSSEFDAIMEKDAEKREPSFPAQTFAHQTMDSIVVPPKSPMRHGTPPVSQGGRRWSRKVD